MEKAGFKLCTVCGKEFALTAEEHYVAREDTQTGLRASLGGEESKLYDVMDCPYCGSQMLLNRRLRDVCPCDYGICDECGEYEDEEEEIAELKSPKGAWDVLRGFLDKKFSEEDE